MMERMTLAEAKEYWFGRDLTVVALHDEGEFWGALPKREVERGHKYLRKLESCQRIEDAQAVFEEYTADIESPKLLPWRLVNFLDVGDLILEFIESKIIESSPKYLALEPHLLQKMSDLELYELVKEEPFDLYESRFYRDESDINMIYAQASLVTDLWVPLEIAKSVGVRDEGTGFFHETVENVYPEFSKFSKAFTDLGFEVVIDSVELRELLGFKVH